MLLKKYYEIQINNFNDFNVSFSHLSTYNHNYNELKESLIAFSFSLISEKSNLERFKRENSEDSISRFDRASTYRIKNSKYQKHQRQNVMSYIITLSSALALFFMILILNPDG